MRASSLTGRTSTRRFGLASFYLDNDVSSELTANLQARGHDVLHTRTSGRSRASDDEQLLTATQLRRILVTHNERDFLLVHHAWRRWPRALSVTWPPHPGILVIPQPPQFAVEHGAEQLDRLVRSGRTLTNELYRFRMISSWQRDR